VSGHVFLVGAGPGDPKLITLRGLECLARADVVVYDRLAAPELLDHVRPDAERIFVGKRPGRHTLPQEDIDALLVDLARPGKMVVRLKGGDPFVFGRGGEEGLALARAGVSFEVVPGVTSAIAAAAAAGIPVTHRGIASSFTVATGHEDPTKPDSAIRWEHLATGADTLVFLMGIDQLGEIVASLVGAGRSTDEPAAAVRWGTTARQQVVVGTLRDIADRVREAQLAPPAVLIVGKVVELRSELDWRSRLPLAGLRVLVTRARHQASQLSARLVELGATPIEYPVIEIRPVEDSGQFDAALARIADFSWVVFTSTNGVDAVFDRLAARGKDARALAAIRVCAIGPSTAAALKSRGIVADWMPEQFITDALVAGFHQFDLRDRGVLLARADIAPPGLADGLRAQGARVTEVAAYRTVPAASRDRLLTALEAGEIDLVTLTSSSTVRNLVEGLNGRRDLLSDVAVACIGPVTASTAHELGLRVDVEAAEHTLDGLIEAIVTWASDRSRMVHS
jgi:uroporphyrinogen III methyltransferase / synthase